MSGRRKWVEGKRRKTSRTCLSLNRWQIDKSKIHLSIMHCATRLPTVLKYFDRATPRSRLYALKFLQTPSTCLLHPMRRTNMLGETPGVRAKYPRRASDGQLYGRHPVQASTINWTQLSWLRLRRAKNSKDRLTTCPAARRQKTR